MRRIVLILWAILLLLPLGAYAQSPAIDLGLGYLTTSQNPDRSWGGAGGSTETVASTVAVLDTLKLLNQTDLYEYTGAVSWLQSQDLDTTEHLSERINTLTIGGADATKLLSYLDSLMNAWGGYNDYGVSIIDTVHALQALRTINHPDSATFASALGYLTTSQNSDGGWGFFKGDASNTYVSSLVLRTLAEFKSTYTGLQPAIGSAVTFILSKQDNTSSVPGGFGSSPSTVHETALAYEALVMSGVDVSAAIPQAITYLAQTQQLNGSWNNDPYATALALKALSNVKPNLSISANDITLSDTNLTVGEHITISAIIKNTGMVAADRVTVNVYDGDPLKGTLPLTSQIIPTMAAGGQVTLTVPYTVSGNGSHAITVWVDPLNQIAEVTKVDNRASKNIWGATLPDVAVLAGDIAPSTFYPGSGVAFDVVFKLRNLGETEAYPVNTALYDGNPAQGGTPIGYGMPTTVKAGETRSNVVVGAVLNTLGQHTLYLVANYDNLVTESTLSNNTATFTVNVGGTPPPVDIVVSPQDLTVTPSRPATGEIVQLSAVVRNQGQDTAAGFALEFYDGDPSAGGILIASHTVTLAGGNEQTVTASWAIPAGIHTIYAIADRTNIVAEVNELNNRAMVTVMANMVDITLSSSDMTFSPSHPVDGDAVTLTITLRNAGIMGTGAFETELYDGDPNAGGVLLQTFPVPNIPGDGSQTLTYSFNAIPHTYRFYAVADRTNQVYEMYEENNLAVRSVKIKSPSEVLGPDLVPVKLDLSGTATDPQSLAISGNALVTFQNKGDDKITSSFNVTVFEDKDNDGKYTQGVDTTLGMSTFVTGPTASVPAIWPEGAGMVSVPLSGTVKFLHSPLYALIDSSDAIVEQSETNNLVRSGADCENRPDTAIKPKLKWKWRTGPSALTTDNVGMPPVVAPLKDTNGDGIVNGNDDPYVLFIAPSGCGANCTRGRLRAVNGKTGVEEFSFTDSAHYMEEATYIAVGDINNDGLPEICMPGGSTVGGAVICLKNDGKLLWDNYPEVMAWGNGAHVGTTDVLSIADIDGDGKPEIIAGNVVFSGDRSVKWGYSSTGFSRGYGATEVADLDLDGKQEIIAGNTAYNFDGTVKWTNSSLPDGMTAIANLNGDQYPEIVYMGQSTRGARIYLLDHLGNILWGPIYVKDLDPTLPGGGLISPMTIADFDGDGEVEIGFKGFEKFLVLNKNDGSLKISYATVPGASMPFTATVFDLDGDGRPEVIINARQYFKIYDGKSSMLLYQENFGGYFTSYQNTIVADVDGDGHAEIVAVGGDLLKDPLVSQAGVNVYGSDPGFLPWVGARGIWNQGGYHVTNVNDNGTIPQHEAPSWLLNNTYHCQAPVGTSTNPYLTPNLTASYFSAAQNGTGYDLTVRIGNGGAVEAPAGIPVMFNDGDPAAGGTTIGTVSTTKILLPGEYQDITMSVGALADGQHALYAKVDGGTGFKECNLTDNQARLDLTILSGLPDLKVGSEDISVPNSTVTEGTIVTLAVNVKDIGLANAANVTVKLSNGNPAAGGTWIGLPQTVGSISAGGTAALTFTFDTLGKTGQNILYVSVDPDNTVIEATKANNIASIVINVQPPQFANLVVGASNIQITPASPREGEQATISAVITNRGAEVGNIPVRFTLGNPATGGTVISEQTIYPMLGLGQSATVNATLNTIGLAGQREIYVAIDPVGTITESSKNDNAASKSLFIQSAGLTAAVSLDKPEYQLNEAVYTTVTASNDTATIRTMLLTVQVKDSAGAVIAAVSQAEPVTINPSATVALTKAWNTGNTLAGGYTMAIEIAEAGLTIARGTANFSIAPDKRIDAKVTTNKIAYYPNEAAELTSVVASGSANYAFENLTAAMTILSADGQQTVIKTDTRTIRNLMPGAAYTFKSYWNTGTNSPGAYPVNVLVTDSTGSVVASGSKTLTITSDLKPSALLTGNITLDKQSTMSNEPVSATYTVTNIGNVDLSGVALSVKTVHVKNQTIYGTMTDAATLPLATSVTTTRQIDTTSYSAMDYLVVLQASINGGTEETIAGSYFRVEGAPTVPALSSPPNGSDVQTLTPVLSVNNASDPNDDRLTYEFGVYADSGLTILIATAGGIAQGTGITSFQVPAELTENSTYYWRSRAYDGKLYSEWMSFDAAQERPASFRVNVANDLPIAPTIASPPDNTEVPTLTPVLTVNNASDPDSTSLTYNFMVTLDSGCTQTVSTVTGVLSGQGNTSWQVTPALSENTWYYWCAQADDWLDVGPWSAPARFFVNTINNPPTVPVILSPSDNAVVASQNVNIVLQNSTDIDSPVISYFIEIDTKPTFDSGSTIRSGLIPAGSGTTIWQAIGLLDNTQYYARAMASDGSAGSGWPESPVKFFVNIANDAPTTPTIANPSNGAGVKEFNPLLSVHNATDADHDTLTYEFEVCSDAAYASRVVWAGGILETAGTTSWTVTVTLTENQTYYWRARAVDGQLAASGWAEGWFVVNKANDAPGAPTLFTPLNGSSVDTATPTLTVLNAVDPDRDRLTYEFEVYNGTTLAWSTKGVPEGAAGNTSVSIPTALSNNTVYQWQSRAYDGDRYGPWTAKANFTVHLPQAGITVNIEIEPETLNQKSNGNWVMAEIELPHGFNASDVDISSIRLEGTVPAVAWPREINKHHHEQGCDRDHGSHDHSELKVKFRRSEVIAVLPAGNHVPVHVTGTVAGTPFEGVDIIRVIH